MVPKAQAPPQSKVGGRCSAAMPCGLPSSGLWLKVRATRASCASVGRKVLSVIFSGFQTVSTRWPPRVLPLTFSTTAPSTSKDRLYSYTVPGW